MISPAIHFNGTCLKAMHFYEDVFGGTDKEIAFYRDAPSNSDFTVTPDMMDWVMHASMTVSGTSFNFSDTDEEVLLGNAICFNTFMESEEDVAAAYEKLKVGGQVLVELGPQFFSKMYASVIDEFGVRWQLIA